MAALLEKIQPTYGADPQIPRRASRSQVEPQAGPTTRNASRGTSARQPVRSAYQTQRTATTAQSQGYSITDDIEEEDLPSTNPPGRMGSEIKRLTGRLNPYRPRTESGKIQANQTRGNAWLALLRGFLSGGWFAVISKIVTLVVLLYTLLFFIILGCIVAYSTWNYGPTHTSYTTAVINGNASTIQTSNQGGTIYVTIINKSSRTYTTMLNGTEWGENPADFVATAEVTSGQNITIHLIGNINYFHPLFVRPEKSFSLVSDGQAGYKVVQP